MRIRVSFFIPSTHNRRKQMQVEWYEDFFHGLAVDSWRQAITKEQTQAEANFIAETLNLSAGARVLDVPCGNGRHSIELTKQGYRMTGVDLSAEFIAEARLTAGSDALNIEWVHSDMRAVGAMPEFDGAFCYGNSFGYMRHEESAEFLRAVNRCLKPKARFVLETGFAAESLLPSLPGKRWYRLGDIFQLSEAEYDASESQLRVHYTFIRDAAIQTGTARYSLYTIAEFKRLFAACGFVVQELLGSISREPYRLGGRLILVAQK
jgi:SAM-dependent methyltransferase